MSAHAKAFAAAVISIGMAIIMAGLFHSSWPDPERFSVYLLLIVLSSCFKVALPGINGNMSASLVVVLVSIVELSPAETLVLGCIGSVVQTCWQKKQFQSLHVLFNASDIAICVGLCYTIFHRSQGLPGLELPLWLLLTAAVYFLANTLPVAGIIALTEHKQFHTVWSECYFWTFPNYLVGATAASVIIWLNASLGWQASVLLVPIIYLMYRSYVLYLGKLVEERKHAGEIADMHLRTIEALALAIDAKDHTTHDHLDRVRAYAIEIGKQMGLSELDLEALRAAALLHDIGKLGVPEHIINKPGRLTPEEFEKMKIHPSVGAEILERVNFPYAVVPIVRAHHERWDGTGYPDGLSGEQIPVGARILAAVDCLDALISDRQYRRALPMEAAMLEIVRHSGSHFDPRVVEILERRYPELESIATAAHRCTGGQEPARDLKLGANTAPDAGFEAAPQKLSKGDFMASIVAARYEAQALLEFSNHLGNSLSLYETLSVVAARCKKLVPYDAIAIYLARGEKLIPEYVTGDDFRMFSSLEIPIGEGLSGWVARNQRPIVNGNPSVESGYLNNPDVASSMSAALAVPLKDHDDQLLGVLTLYRMHKDAFSSDHLRILLSISDKIGASIENAVKYQAATDSATVDYLTGLPNARALFEHLDAEISRCRREGSNLALVVCDLDGFKSINDKAGHIAGNKVLQTFASKLSQHCRPYDFVSRMGGDEFVLITPGLNRADALDLCERIREAARNSVCDICDGATLSASVGAAFYPIDADDGEQLLVAADRKMYAMKDRNQGTDSLLAMPVRILMTQ
jgi:diguanylate cyclase (GGDEF)-like protein/putative nucleotidyltransferase with HDIG domain